MTDLALAQLTHEHAPVVAVIANRVDPAHLDEIAAAVAARMPEGVPSWVIPEEPTLVAPLLRTVFDAAHAELVRGDAALLERPVLATVVAAMSLENVLPRLLEGAVVVVPGDRSDVLVGTLVAQLSQTFPSLAGILLNGGFPLSPSIERVIEGLSTALPIARTELGTFDTITALAGARSRLAADSPQKYALALGPVRAVGRFRRAGLAAVAHAGHGHDAGALRALARAAGPGGRAAHRAARGRRRPHPAGGRHGAAARHRPADDPRATRPSCDPARRSSASTSARPR